MKKTVITIPVCALVLCAALVLTGCDGLSGANKPSVNEHTGGGADTGIPGIPDNIPEQALADMPIEYQTEIKSLYGCYWPDNGDKSECSEIGEKKLVAYSSFMGMRFSNIRWSRVNSQWQCTSYGVDVEDYDPGERRIIFKFIKDGSGKAKLYKTIVRMGTQEYGPNSKGKAPDKIEEGGKTFYVYDKKDPKAPKMKDYR